MGLGIKIQLIKIQREDYQCINLNFSSCKSEIKKLEKTPTNSKANPMYYSTTLHFKSGKIS